MQFQVPQFINAEDKIVGPFSIRQFIYVAIAGMISVMLYFSIGGFVWVLGSVIVFGFAGALAFVKIEGRPFLDVLIAAGNFYWKPQIYVWQPEHRAPARPKAQLLSLPPVREPGEYRQKAAAGSGLHKVLATLQTGEKGMQSDKEFLERKMETRYQIFRRETGDRGAARRVDYR